jgi:hypothetical protein
VAGVGHGVAEEVVAMSAVASPDIAGLAVAALLGTVVVTPALSAVVLWRYRRAVGLSMTTGRDRPPIPVPEGQAVGHGAGWSAPRGPVILVDAVAIPRGALRREIRHRMWSLASVYAAAGVAFGLVAASVWLTAFGLAIEVQRLTLVAVLLAWPLVPTLLTVMAAGRRAWIGSLIGYFAALLLLTLAAQARLTEILFVVVGMVAPPVVMLLAFSGRTLRAVGPFLVAPVLIVSVGLLLWPWTGYFLLTAGASGTLAQGGAVLAAVIAGAAGFGYLAWIARSYVRKRASDQTLLISQWWFLATAWESLLFSSSGLGAAVGVWIAYLAFRIVMAIGLRLRPRSIGAPPRLLLLRTFGAQRRSELLLRRLSSCWRHVGTVQMIAGTDLAGATLEPHEFLDRLRGRLDRQFIGDAEHLRRRLEELDDRPDPDGRYRINDLFCHDNTWRAALHALLNRSDCVLVDVRGFTPERRGVAYEITQLVQLARLERVLLLTDSSTDRRFLTSVVAAASDRVGPGSGGGSIQAFHIERGRSLEPDVLLGLLDGAVQPLLAQSRPRRA